MGEEGGDIDPMMLMFMMNQNGGANTSVFGNPMMMYFLMKDRGEIDPRMMFMMMNPLILNMSMKLKIVENV